MLHRLVRRAVLADPDRVVAEDENDRQLHDRGQADRWPHIVAEYQEGGGEGAQVTKRHAVGDGAHGVFAHAEMHIAPAGRGGFQILFALRGQFCLGRWRQVGRAAEQALHLGGDGVQHLARGVARGDPLGVGLERWQVPIPAVGQMAAAQLRQFMRQVGEGLRVVAECLVPGLAQRMGAVRHNAVQMVEHAVGDQELRVLGPAIDLLRRLDDVGAHGVAVRLGRASDRRAVADDGLQHDQGGGGVIGLEGLDGAGEGLGVVGVVEVDDAPAIAFETLAYVLAEGQRRAAFDGDAVAVVDPAQVRQFLVAGDRGGFGSDPLHHVAVAAEDIDIVIEQGGVRLVEVRAQPAAGHGHADRIAAALAQRAGGGFYAGGQAVFRVAGRLRIELAEVFDVVEADGGLAGRLAVGVDLLDARHVQQAVQQHRGVAARQDEAVAIGPVGPVGIVAQEARPQGIGRRRQGHRRAGMAGLGLFDCVHSQGADGVDAQRVERRARVAHRLGGIRMCHGRPPPDTF